LRIRACGESIILSIAMACAAQQPIGTGWPTYGGDPGGMRFSNSTQITRANLNQLHVVWTFHTHALDSLKPNTDAPAFEATPVLSGETLYVTSPYDVVFALDAQSGSERWRFDPFSDHADDLRGIPLTTSRGVAIWPVGESKSPNPHPCSQRVFVATLDARLIALDSATGRPCIGFGENGSIDIRQAIDPQDRSSYSMTSPPTIVGDVVIIGSSILDNQQVDVPSGALRGFDVFTGKLLWTWEPLPWANAQNPRTGGGNAWSIISADRELGLVYVPTGSASNDFFGGTRPGNNSDADSVVALEASTGRKVWAFQLVHHDVWDYDVPSEPVLFTWRNSVPAIAITSKMGMIFLLDRRTGTPVIPVNERPVPKSDVPGERLSPTQPFPEVPPLSPLQFDYVSSSGFQRPAEDEAKCRAELSRLRYEGPYTPPSVRGTLYYPGNLGGVNWGGAAIDPTTGILYANTNREAFSLRLIPRRSLEGLEAVAFPVALRKLFHWEIWIAMLLLAVIIDLIRRRTLMPRITPFLIVLIAGMVYLGVSYVRVMRASTRNHFREELSNQNGTPFLVERKPIIDSHGLSCTPAPWGAIAAVNLTNLTKIWEQPLGTRIYGQQTGTANFGGPIVTASGLVITAAAEDPWLRVFDAANGKLMREIPLPVPAQSTPMTYTLDGRQYVVVAAGGHDLETKLGDSLIAFGIR
jgi:quinoprotein glucose dehydrogenase